MEKVAALKSQMGGPAKNAPPPEARPSYAELSAMRERLQRSEVEKKSIELLIQDRKLEMKRVELEIAQSQERRKALEVEAKTMDFEVRKVFAREIGKGLTCAIFGCLIVNCVSSFRCSAAT